MSDVTRSDSSTLAFTDGIFDSLLDWLDFSEETAGVLLMRRGSPEGGPWLARRLIPVPDEHYLERSPWRLRIASAGFVPALGQAESDSAVACFVHSHPGGAATPSDDDHIVDAELRDLFSLRTRSGTYASLIIGGTRDRPTLSARVFRSGCDPEAVACFRVVGRRLRFLFAEAESHASPAIYDRQILAFGPEGQATLGQLRVGVVGAGGTGSAVVEQLLRLGVHRLMVIDPDEIDPSNLTRIHESRMSDSGRPKVDVAERLGADLGVGQLVESTVGRVNTIAVARQLVDCDVVFGCTDDHAGRSVLSRLAYWYLIPVIDMGVVIDAEAPGAAGVFGRVSVVQPGTACLICRGVVDPVRVREESLPEAERESLRREGYVRGLDAPDPSVISFTTLVASWSVGELLQRMFTESDDMPPSELLFRIHDRRIGTRVPQPQEGHYCGDASVWGSGDEASFLGQVW